MFGVHDRDADVAAEAQAALLAIGQQYEQENAERLLDVTNYGTAAEAPHGLAALTPRPTLGERLIVSDIVSSVKDEIVTNLSDWAVNTRYRLPLLTQNSLRRAHG